MGKLVYEPIAKMSKRAIGLALRSGDPDIMLRALLSAALYSGDGLWAEKLVFKFIDHNNPYVRGNAMVSLGHIARIHGSLDRERAIDVLRVATNDRHEFVRGHAIEALEDVRHWIKQNGRWLGEDM